MRNVRRRLHMLERLRQFQRPPGALEQIIGCVLRQISDEDLELLIGVARDEKAGTYRTLSQSESAAVAAHNTALEAESRRMGFRSFAMAERTAGQSR